LLKLSFSAATLESSVKEAAKGDTEEVRRRTANLVSRDVTDMEEGHLHSSLLETLSENFTDSYLTPLLYYTLLGLPGALLYRALDTTDSMYGYPTQEARGKIPAKLEDAATYPASILSILPTHAATHLTRGRDAALKGLEASRKYADARQGYNGRIMAYYAGALDVQPEKPGDYTMNQGSLPGKTDIMNGVKLFQASAATSIPLLLAALQLRKWFM